MVLLLIGIIHRNRNNPVVHFQFAELCQSLYLYSRKECPPSSKNILVTEPFLICPNSQSIRMERGSIPFYNIKKALALPGKRRKTNVILFCQETTCAVQCSKRKIVISRKTNNTIRIFTIDVGAIHIRRHSVFGHCKHLFHRPLLIFNQFIEVFHVQSSNPIHVCHNAPSQVKSRKRNIALCIIQRRGTTKLRILSEPLSPPGLINLHIIHCRDIIQ